MSFARAVLLRLLTASFVFVLVLLLAFAALSTLLPDGPIAADAPMVTARRTYTPEEREMVRESLGLHLPLLWNTSEPCPERTAATAIAAARADMAAWPRVEHYGALAVLNGSVLVERWARHAAPPNARWAAEDAAFGAQWDSFVARIYTAAAGNADSKLSQAWASAGVDASVAAFMDAVTAASMNPTVQSEILRRETERVLALGGLALESLMARQATAPFASRLAAWDCIAHISGLALDTQAAAREGEHSVAVQTLEARLQRWWRRERAGFTKPSAFTAATRYITHTRFWRWCAAASAGDLGESLEYRQPVSSVLAQHLPATLRLGASALLFMLLLAVPLGILWSNTRSAIMRRSLALLAALAASTPEVVLGTLLLLVSRGNDGTIQVAPVIVLGLGGALVLATHLHAALQDLQREPWVLALRGRGVPERRILTRHLLRHALSPVVTLLGAALPVLVGGSVVVEHIFGLQGMGEVSWVAASNGDVALAMACVALGSALALIGWLLADLVAAWLDPRRATYGRRS